MSETDLLHTLILRAPLVVPGIRLFRRNIINHVVVEADRKYALRNGIAGQCDAYALTRGGGHVEIETKSATGSKREAQKRWRAFCLKWDVPHLVLRARRGESPEDTVTRWIDELRAVVESKAA